MKETEWDNTDTQMTAPFVMENLEILKQYYEEMELESEIIPAMKELPLPALVTALGEDEKDRPRILTNSFLPFDRENAEFTKYLQFYLELTNPLEKIDSAELLNTMLWVNGQLPIGCCMIREAEGERPSRVVVRSNQGFPLTKPIDQGVFTEDVFLFDTSCDIVSNILDLMAEGKSFAEIRALLERES